MDRKLIRININNKEKWCYVMYGVGVELRVFFRSLICINLFKCDC